MKDRLYELFLTVDVYEGKDFDNDMLFDKYIKFIKSSYEIIKHEEDMEVLGSIR